MTVQAILLLAWGCDAVSMRCHFPFQVSWREKMFFFPPWNNFARKTGKNVLTSKKCSHTGPADDIIYKCGTHKHWCPTRSDVCGSLHMVELMIYEGNMKDVFYICFFIFFWILNNFIPAVLHSIYPTYRCEWLAKSCSEFYHPRYPLQMYRMWSESQGNCECKKFQEVQNHHHKTFPPKPLLHPAVKAVKKTTHRDSSFTNAGVLIKYPSWLWSRTWRVCELLFQTAKEHRPVDKPGSAWRFVQPVNLVS